MVTKAQVLEEQAATVAHAVAHLVGGCGAEIETTAQAVEVIEEWLVAQGALEPADDAENGEVAGETEGEETEGGDE